MSRKIKWGIIATGAIAKTFANGLKASRTGELFAVASRSQDKADAFAKELGPCRAYGSYEAILADKEVEAVYVSTPHPQHSEWAIKAADAGKHVLVEKPMGINQYEVQAMIDAAVRNGVFLMEAFMYRCHPQTAKLAELIKSQVIGDVRVIQATFSFQSNFTPAGRLWANELAGGGILDVGGYTASISRLIAGAAMGEPFADPVAVTGAGHLQPETGVDAWAIASLKFEKGIVASLATGVGVNQDNVVKIFGSKGRIEVPNPYVAARKGKAEGRIIVSVQGEGPREIQVPCEVTSFTLEADVVGDALLAGKKQADQMSWDDSLGNIRTQDSWRQAIGQIFESEKPAGTLYTISRKPLAVRPEAGMTYGRIRHLDKQVSRLIMGVDNQVTMPHAAMIFDEYFVQGGNAFDTAWIYGKVKSQLLGQWVKNRNLRKDVVLIAKGAHSPECNPSALLRQFNEQLDWLQTDYADLYMMHRDNLAIPASEFVDALNGLVKAGKLKAFGGSNWTRERIDEANSYAKGKGLQGFSIVSNNLSLAVMVKPVWGGCIHVHDKAWTEWFTKRELALLPWSSQARGFFVPERANPAKREDQGLVECWYSDENFKRQARAVELAGKHGVEPINIALAWVLQRPYQTFPLVGPRTLAELRSTLRVFEVKLTGSECAYLDLESDTIK